MALIDKMISGNSCEIGILGNGSIVTLENNVVTETSYNINDMQLTDIVKNLKK